MISDLTNIKGIEDLLTLISENGINNLSPAIEVLLNESMKIERENAVQAGNYERSSDRKWQCNGYKNRNFNSRLGTLRIKIPQVRNMSFYPKSLEKGERSEKALKLAVAEMYVQWVSTIKVA